LDILQRGQACPPQTTFLYKRLVAIDIIAKRQFFGMLIKTSNHFKKIKTQNKKYLLKILSLLTFKSNMKLAINLMKKYILRIASLNINLICHLYGQDYEFLSIELDARVHNICRT